MNENNHPNAEHSPNYAQWASTPVKGEERDIVIYMCTCGEEGCTWQILVEARNKAHFGQ